MAASTMFVQGGKWNMAAATMFFVQGGLGNTNNSLVC